MIKKIIIEALKVALIILIIDVVCSMAFGIVPIQWDTAGIAYGLGAYAATKGIKTVHNVVHG